MPGRGASGGLAGARIHESQSNPKTGPNTGPTTVRFRLIVDDSATINPSACALPQRLSGDAVSPSTISLIQASTIAEIRTRAFDSLALRHQAMWV
jgi:hypothetical protein